MGGRWEGVRWLGWFSRSGQATVLVGLAMLGLAVVCYLVLRAPREPVYQGKTLSVWLETYNPASGPGRGSPAWKAADEALRHIGTNAIPCLLRKLRARDSGLKLRLVAWAQRQHFIKIHFVPAAARNIEASRAFIVLGSTAKAALPDLIKAYQETQSVEAWSAIEDALAWIGPEARPALPLLLRAATNANSRVRANALWALGEIHAQPEACVPALLRGLNDGDAWVQTSAAHALGMFGPAASAAIPALAQFAQLSPLSSRLFGTSAARPVFIEVNIEARRALGKIAPSAGSGTNANGSIWDSSGPGLLQFSP